MKFRVSFFIYINQFWKKTIGVMFYQLWGQNSHAGLHAYRYVVPEHNSFGSRLRHKWYNYLIGKLSRNLARIYSGLNLGLMVSSLYLSDLVYWVGFATGVLFKTHLSNTNFIDLLTLLWKTAFWSELLFFTEKMPFFKLYFPLIFAKPLYHNVRINYRITFMFS